MSPPDLYLGAADYYARYRPPYPEELLETLRDEAGVDGSGRLLDLGCGTGEIAVPMSPHFDEVWAVDQQPEMIELGRERAARSGASNIRWILRTAETVEAASRSFQLITVGAAFHWMDRELIGNRALEWLEPGRCMAVVGSNSPWTGEAEWQALAVDVIRRWLGEERRAGAGTFRKPSRPHEEILRAQGFEDVEQHEFLSPYVWTLDSFIGYLYSTSFASRSVLANSGDEFEADMRGTLLAYDARGLYEESIHFYYIRARKGAVAP
jgi:SAM-dependent methyltransferase